jgi:sulfoxide reductase heme-binding subunit YedZ
MLPYRRELGIYAVIAAIIHTVIILIGWVQLDFARLFGFEFHPQLQEYVMVQQGFGLGNLIGIAALLYGIVLAVTSNDFSQKRLGTSVWKYIQQGAYVLWWLVVLHTAYFLFFHFLDFHRQTPEPNWAQWPFIILVGVVLLLQTAATLVTWRSQRQRRPSSVGAE